MKKDDTAKGLLWHLRIRYMAEMNKKPKAFYLGHKEIHELKELDGFNMAICNFKNEVFGIKFFEVNEDSHIGTGHRFE